MSYIIVFWDKSKVQVNDLIGEKLEKAIITDQIKNFKLGNSLFMVGGVEKIIPKADAFDIFPAEWEHLKRMEDKQTKDIALVQQVEQLTIE